MPVPQFSATGKMPVPQFSATGKMPVPQFSATGKMPVPQEINFAVEQASCLFIKSLVRIIQELSSLELARN